VHEALYRHHSRVRLHMDVDTLAVSLESAPVVSLRRKQRLNTQNAIVNAYVYRQGSTNMMRTRLQVTCCACASRLLVRRVEG